MRAAAEALPATAAATAAAALLSALYSSTHVCVTNLEYSLTQIKMADDSADRPPDFSKELGLEALTNAHRMFLRRMVVSGSTARARKNFEHASHSHHIYFFTTLQSAGTVSESEANSMLEDILTLHPGEWRG